MPTLLSKASFSSAFVVVATAALGGLPGCATLPSGAEADLAKQVAQAEPARGEVVVELRSENHTQHLKAPLRGNMLVEDALKGAGALREFNRMNVVVVRQLPDGGKLRMPVTFNSDTRAVNAATNFALYPGDVVEVTEDPRTLLDRVIDQALSTLGPIAHHQRHQLR